MPALPTEPPPAPPTEPPTAPPTEPPAPPAFVTAVQGLVGAFLEVLMSDMWCDPRALILFGAITGGALGWHLAALCAGFLEASLLNATYQPAVRFVVESAIALDALCFKHAALRCVPVHSFGHAAGRVCASRLLTAPDAARLTLAAALVLAPTWSGLACLFLVTLYEHWQMAKRTFVLHSLTHSLTHGKKKC